MNIEIHEFCRPDEKKKPKERVHPEERARMVQEIITRTSLPSSHNIQATSNDPLDFIPNYQLTLSQTLSYISNKTNKILLEIAWKKLPYFRVNHNLLLSHQTTFIRKAVNPKGIIVHMHMENNSRSKVIHSYYLVDNPFVQEIKEITFEFPLTEANY